MKSSVIFLFRVVLSLWVLFLSMGCGGSKQVSSGGVNMSGEIKTVDVAKSNLEDGKPQNPKHPGDISISKVPMFVTLGFDDNGVAGDLDTDFPQGMAWADKMLSDRKNSDGTPALASFYITSSYGTGDDNGYGEAGDSDPSHVKKMWNTLYSKGYEIGNHTSTHPHGVDEESGVKFPVESWVEEMKTCNNVLTAPFDVDEIKKGVDKSKGAGVDPSSIVGFRTPFLEYTDFTFDAIAEFGFKYDCSIEEGIQSAQDGTNFTWPYKLDNGSRGHDLLVEWEMKIPMKNHPGLWEMPVYVVIVPPDAECEKYGVEKGLRDRLKSAVDYFETDNGKITGFDYNLWVLFHMTKNEFVATMKYTFDLRMKGNKAPFLFGMHSDIYADGYDEENEMKAKVKERQEAVEEFLDYVLKNSEVRVSSAVNVLKWIESPIEL
ncbi:MAG: hypothetical protein JXR91_10735 [Deltaproteobacteria bacterium]|nr:hypothetical protein [Deltaproteobacteria bacterium]